MKKSKKSKNARKAIRKKISFSLIAKLKEVAVNFAGDTKKIEKKIKKASNNLAKKLSKIPKVDKLGGLEAGIDQQRDKVLVSAKPENLPIQKRRTRAAKTTTVVKKEVKLS